jgi:hypothetical protein
VHFRTFSKLSPLVRPFICNTWTFQTELPIYILSFLACWQNDNKLPTDRLGKYRLGGSWAGWWADGREADEKRNADPKATTLVRADWEANEKSRPRLYTGKGKEKED